MPTHLLTIKPLSTPHSQVLADVSTSSASPGLDGVTYTLLDHLPLSAKVTLLTLFNTCYLKDTIPTDWKKGEVIPIHKQDKARNDPNSYRPITLSSHISKLLERIIKNRLEYTLNKTNSIPKEQAGFRKKRSTTEHLYNLTSHIKTTLKKKRQVLAVFFDIKRAFDTVWHRKLLQKLQVLGYSGHFYQYIKNFLERTITVRVNSTRSTTRTLTCGVPQGTVLAPTLFNILLADLPMHMATQEHSVNKPHTSQFADDLALWKQYKMTGKGNEQKAIKDFQKYIDTIHAYMSDNGFQISTEKAHIVLFNRTRYKPTLKLSLNGTPIDYAETVKFLGVTFSHKLSWRAHIHNLIYKANKAANLLKYIQSLPFGVHRKTLIHVFQAIIRSNLTYGQECFHSAPGTYLKQLERTETKLLKNILGLPMFANNTATYTEANIQPLHIQRQQACALFLARIRQTDNAACDTHAQEQINEQIFKTKQEYADLTSLHAFTTHTLQNIHLDTIAKIPQHPTPPWFLEHPNIQFNNISTPKADPHRCKAEVQELLRTQYQNFLHIYTDGSKDDSGHVACAYHIPALTVTHMAKLGTHYSIMTAELTAISLALQHLLDFPHLVQAAVILTDSKSSLQALASSHSARPDLVVEIQQQCHALMVRGTVLTLQWIPSHIGIAGNELADSLAKQALRSPQTTVQLRHSYSEVASLIKQRVHKALLDERRDHCIRHPKLHTLQLENSILHLCLSRATASTAHRLRTGSWRAKHGQVTCLCGEDFDPEHMLFQCDTPPIDLTDTRQALAINNISSMQTLLANNPLTVLVSKAIASSTVRKLI